MPTKKLPVYLLLSAFTVLFLTTRQSNAEACDPAASSQASLNVCSRISLQNAEDEQTEALKQLTERKSQDSLAKLKIAQKKWRAYRDAQCDFETNGSLGGSVYPMVYMDCQSALTQKQTKRLLDQLNCEEGNIGCGQP